MRFPSVRGVAVALALLAAGCGDDGPTQPTRVRVNYQGQWTGDYSVSACTATGAAFTGFCTDGFRVGNIYPMTLTLTQANDAVSGTLQLGTINYPVSGPVSADGRLLLTGAATVVQGATQAQSTLGNWSTTLSGTTSMVGGWGTSWTVNAGVGNGQVTHTIRILTKTG